MRVLWVVQSIPADGVVTGDYVVVAKLARALTALGAECRIVPARAARDEITRDAPDRVVLHGFVEPEAWEFLGRLGERLPTVFWWCTMHFDPNWGERVVRPSRFSAIATNSPTALGWLADWGHRHTLLLHTAADERDLDAAPDPTLAHPVVFLGIGQHKDAAQEEMMLGPARDLGLAIYGARWGDTPWASSWKGLLPPGREATLYRSSRVALGMTEREQLRAGMINNRPFEVLAAGATFVTPRYPALEALFGERVLYTTSADETRRLLVGVLEGTITVPDSRAWIRAHHTYLDRAERLLGLLTQL